MGGENHENHQAYEIGQRQVSFAEIESQDKNNGRYYKAGPPHEIGRREAADIRIRNHQFLAEHGQGDEAGKAVKLQFGYPEIIKPLP